jgi:N6-L-threonylcarbamoyladenine synthase
VVDVLVSKTIAAAKEYGVKDIAMAGGVSANSALRRAMSAAACNANVRLFVPKLEYCTDNGAMIATVGYRKFLRKSFSPISESAVAGLELGAQSTN